MKLNEAVLQLVFYQDYYAFQKALKKKRLDVIYIIKVQQNSFWSSLIKMPQL